MKDRKKVMAQTPVFHNEAEEARWWAEHRELVGELLMKHGRAVPTKSVTVRLPVPDIARARELAARRGLGYQTLIKILLHDALKREMAKQS